jgi:hypothetical protein
VERRREIREGKDTISSQHFVDHVATVSNDKLSELLQFQQRSNNRNDEHFQRRPRVDGGSESEETTLELVRERDRPQE